MAKENFMPRGQSEVKRRLNGKVERIIAVYGCKKVLIVVDNGKPRRINNEEMPYFVIPEKNFYEQIGEIIANGEKTAKRFKDVKKLDWAANLGKCNIIINPDGKVTTYRGQYNKKTGVKKRVPMPARDIGAAIRMQYHIGEYYDRFYPPTILGQLLKKLAIIQPVLELRTLQLIFARDQMQETVNQAFARLNRIGEIATDANGPKFDVLTEKIAQLIFLLKNQWACPYLPIINETIKALKKAKGAAGRQKLETAKLQIVNAKFCLKQLTSEELTASKKLSEIDPIMTLGKIGWLNKTDEVLTIAKRKFPGQKFFHLDEMLAISRFVIALAESKPAAATTTEPANKRKKSAGPAMTGQAAFSFG